MNMTWVTEDRHVVSHRKKAEDKQIFATALRLFVDGENSQTFEKSTQFRGAGHEPNIRASRCIFNWSFDRNTGYPISLPVQTSHYSVERGTSSR